MTKIKVKQLKWEQIGKYGSYYSDEFDLRITTNGSGWGLSPTDFPHLGDFEHKTLADAKAAAQREFEEYILSMIEIIDD